MNMAYKQTVIHCGCRYENTPLFQYEEHQQQK